MTIITIIGHGLVSDGRWPMGQKLKIYYNYNYEGIEGVGVRLSLG